MQNSQLPAVSEPAAAPSKRPHELSGRWVVVGMFVFAAAATGGMWVYWKLHIAPFLPLQEALAEAFPGSRPRVEGGQRKMSKNTPRILRITARVDFDPTRDQNAAEVDRFADRLAAVAREKQNDLSSYELLELHLFWPEPEQEIRQRTIVRKVSTN